MDIIERVARAIAGANMDERINLYEDDAKAAIAALADDLDEKALAASYQAAADRTSEFNNEMAITGEHERYPHWPVIESAIRVYLQSLKETTNG